ncbi:MAG TPA: permease-like cell division protein FtsX [Actinomycetota bacterium]|nr:permease-like cell division protein FtsX [Actinomycetota bacterium]
MRLRYFLSETLTNLRRNLLMSVAAVSTVAISLLLLGGVQILGIVVGNMTRSWEAKVEVSVFLLDDITEGEQQALVNQLTNMDEVEDVTYVSKQDAYEEFKQEWADQPEFYENLPEDALPASLRVKLTDARYSEAIATLVNGAPGVEEARFGGDIIRRLLKVNSLLRSITLVMSIVLMIASAALIANTIRVAIYARRDEIGIMKLVGATNWFIRVPFLIEGMVEGLLGGLIAVLAIFAMKFAFIDPLRGQVGFVHAWIDTPEILFTVPILIGAGVLIAAVASLLAMRRFLEV